MENERLNTVKVERFKILKRINWWRRAPKENYSTHYKQL